MRILWMRFSKQIESLEHWSSSTRDLLNVIAAVSERGAGFRSLKDTWADTTTAHGRLMLTVLGGLAEPFPDGGWPLTWKGSWPSAQDDAASAPGSHWPMSPALTMWMPLQSADWRPRALSSKARPPYDFRLKTYASKLH